MAHDWQTGAKTAGPKKPRPRVWIAVSLGIWVFSLLAFWLFTGPTDGIIYSIVFPFLLLPITTISVSFLFGKHNSFGPWKWIAPALFGVMYMLAEYATFPVCNMLAFGTFNLPSFGLIPAGAVMSLIGLVGGTLVRRVKTRLRARTKQQ